MEAPGWLVTTTFLVEGVMLMIVACLGLVGNILSFGVLISQKVQKTFHNLLLLLNTFDTVREIQSTPTFYVISCVQVYLLSSVSLFALPNLSYTFSGTYQRLTLPFMLPVAHIGMVSNH